ncbi:MAG: fasciclin domain-containing protein [Alphaproteobacteria bacterium]|jgi:uncharacterized surface protein with fasciclin (FAS1) repeats|nr:fasciclin domain-containing protein [Alphaproteobacteria bacterium]
MTTSISAGALKPNLFDVAVDSGHFSVFLKAAESVGLRDTLESGGPFTLFAPTDAAFDKFPATTLAKLLRPEHAPLLRTVLLFHFAPGVVPARRFAGTRIRAKSFEGGDLFIDGSDGIAVNRARVVAPDITATNGVIHGIDRVLWPKRPEADAPAAGTAG